MPKIKPHVAIPGTLEGEDPAACQDCGNPPDVSDIHHPPGATLHLGGAAWAFPALKPHLTPLDAVTPFPGNPRRGDQDAITSSIRDHGLYAGTATQLSTGHIVVGNHRRHALADLGATKLPAVPMDIDDATARAIAARDNRTSDQGGYDSREQLALLQAIDADGTSLAVLGFTDADLLILQRAAESEDVFVTDTAHMLDEFKAISGQTDTGYVREYADKVAIYVRDAEAVADLITRLGLPEDQPLPARLHWPLDWQPYDRRQTWQQERDA